jgi:hypothetical protein
MSNLEIYVGIAEIIAAIAIVSGGLFAVVQLVEFRKQRQCQVAADLCRPFTEPELAKAIVLLTSLPDGLSLKEFQELDRSYLEAAQVVGMMFESMGIMVQKNIASFQIVQELAGGLLLMLWRKIEHQIKGTRIEQGNPRFGEWVEWLVNKVSENESEMTPAFEMYATSKSDVKK